jgi:hypothetical protein
MKQEKNADKTIDEIKDIVFKNLAKDPIYYTKNGQFGVDVGYTDDNVALGEPEEPKGEYKSSGYGKIKENKEPINEIAIAGGIVTGGGFTSMNYMDFYGLNEEDKLTDKDVETAEKYADEVERAKAALSEDEAPAGLDRLIDVAEEIFDDGAGMSLRNLGELLDDVKKHMASKYGE